MTNIVLVQKNGSLKQLNAKDVARESLYKKCGFKKCDGFERRTTWKIGNDYVELWAKDQGKANTENKYEMPPPVDKVLYFGTCCFIKTNMAGESIENLTVKQWEKMYETLFGGFEDLNESEEPSEDELENVPDELKTKDGYLKDGFVVDDEELEEEEYVYEC